MSSSLGTHVVESGNLTSVPNLVFEFPAAFKRLTIGNYTIGSYHGSGMFNLQEFSETIKQLFSALKEAKKSGTSIEAERDLTVPVRYVSLITSI